MNELKFNGRTLWMMRSFTNADYSEKVILSKSLFNFVDSWLMSHSTMGFHKFLHYWRQAKDYYSAGIDAKSEVKPLLNYYCCLNMVKCLLFLKRVNVENIVHGVGWQKSDSIDLEDQKIDFMGTGALKELRNLLGKNEGERTYSLKTLLYNLVCVHRAYCYTYPSDREIFVPLKSLKYLKKGNTDKINVVFEIGKYSDETTLSQNIPSVFEFTTNTKEDWDQIKTKAKEDKIAWGIKNSKLIFRSKREEIWNESASKNSKNAVLLSLHKKVRPYFQYISAEEPLWYIKKEDAADPRIIDQCSTVISFAAMHCLSEMVRYKPELYAQLLESPAGWLLTEFIEVGMDQFIDEIASEITGLNIMMSGIRGKR